MNFEIQKLSNEELGEKLNCAVREERKVTLQVLKLLREVERRELFARHGFSSLFTSCVEYLKYLHMHLTALRFPSDDLAIRRRANSH